MDRPLPGPVRRARLILLLQGLVMVPLALFSPYAGYIGSQEDPELQALGPLLSVLVFGVTGVAFFGGISVLSLLAWVGIGKRRKWGWQIGAVSVLPWVCGACLPVSLYVVFGLLGHMDEVED